MANRNSKARFKLLRADIRKRIKSGENATFDSAQRFLLAAHSSREEDKRPSRSGTTSFRYKGI